ncbi:FKBP-type peptidyl-prolyl cis-trans isomerase [Roseisolibacter sp. H3M3-2]|uniref:FKBP-type peptidyl-prolyl cis-trans isomerase n=1 Tax=Roseisolibacter sp. H3M3-2 TaxID=3031323 RepID=UPI0023DBF878|nr:FKBP-type peptidyl-prolyl cis-trans isomerase [Roseisolibacter sp. H3M3-2]MDF1502383.1 FKBP-type peptidyl-prolyl cis-trans isomerase [Roseisolibacter sp. H3M3-2]
MRRGAAALAMVAVAAACTPRARAVNTPSGLRYTVLARGEGRAARKGQLVSIHEETALQDGTVVYTSKGGRPITFRLGGGQVIAGVDEGVTGMKVGERRLLVVPPALSRRTSYPPNTPPDAVLVIDVRLMTIIPDRGAP